MNDLINPKIGRTNSDLGIRVVGGKKMSNGELGAFITMVDSSRSQETFGELREGDQVGGDDHDQCLYLTCELVDQIMKI